MVLDGVVRKSSCIKYRQWVFDKLYVLSNVKHNKTQYFVVYLIRSKPCKRCPALLSGYFPSFAIVAFPLHIVFSCQIVHCERSFSCIHFCIFISVHFFRTFLCFPFPNVRRFLSCFCSCSCFRMESCFHAFCFLCVSYIFFYPIGLVCFVPFISIVT